MEVPIQQFIFESRLFFFLFAPLTRLRVHWMSTYLSALTSLCDVANRLAQNGAALSAADGGPASFVSRKHFARC